MKTFKITLLLFAIIGCSLIYSCKKHTTQVDTNNSKSSYQKKWIISSVTSARPSNNNENYAQRAANDTSFIGIEFTLDSTYVAFYSDGSTNTGHYVARGDSTLILDSLGTIQIKLLDSNSFNFILVRNNGLISISYISTPAIPVSIESTTDSAYVLNTWVTDSLVVTLDDGSTAQVPFSSKQELNFSAYGTYLSCNTDSSGRKSYSINTWTWVDNTHQFICYDNCSNTRSIIFSQSYTHLQQKLTDKTGDISTGYYHKK